MSNELDRRVIRALRNEADSIIVSVSADDIEARLARSTSSSWLLPAVALLGLTAILVVVILGPGRSWSPGDASPSPRDALQSPAPPALLPEDPCLLVTVADVEAATDSQVLRWGPVPEERRIFPDRAPLCEYVTDGVHAGIYLSVHPDGAAGFAQERDADPRNTVVYDDIGDEAFSYGLASVSVRLGAGYFTISTQQGAGSDGVADLRELATATVDRLERGLPRHDFTLPVGIYQSERPFDSICLALRIEEEGLVHIPVSWWTAGGSGDCETRASDIGSATADLSEAPGLRVEIPATEGEPRRLHLRVTGVDSDMIRVARNMEHERALSRVDEVAPTLAVPTVTELPVGTWLSRSAFRDGTICLAIEVTDSLAERHRAWWWHPGGNGNCTTRSSSVLETEVATDEFPPVKLELPRTPSGSETLALRVTGSTDDGLELHGVYFREVEEVDPIEWP